MTDNRTNEPTPEQVEAAARAYDPEAWAARDRFASNGLGTEAELDLMVEYSVEKARAMLTAAGAAPHAESEYAYCPIHGDLLAANRSYRCGNAPTGHEYAAPVQPSSTVDEAALIREAKAEALTEAVAMVSDEEHAFVDKIRGTVVPKLTIIKALRARAAEYRKAVE